MGFEGEGKHESKEALRGKSIKTIATAAELVRDNVAKLSDKHQDLRLWIGNLDAGITEYQLLQLLQKFGRMEKFDYLFHLSGPHMGLPRGYAFVTYETIEGACRCLGELNGKIIRNKPLVIRWARQAVYDYNYERERLKKMLPALTFEASSKLETPDARKRAICAIEAKLRDMEEEKVGQMQFNASVTCSTAAKSNGFLAYRTYGSYNTNSRFNPFFHSIRRNKR